VRVIFAGTPEFARVALERLHAAGHTIALVLTQPDRPAGRGMKLQASSVKQFAQAHGLPVAQPRSLRLDGKFPEDAAAARQAIADANADVMVVAAYGLILPQWVLDDMAVPGKHGCLNIHGSLLPRWRGAAPIHRAIEAGDTETGVTIMQMDAGLDTGDMLMMHRMPITPQDTTATLHDRMADLGGKLIVLALEQAAAGHLKPVPQPAEGVTYAHKIEKHEAAIDWSQDGAAIVRRVRAFNPFPGATATLNGEAIKVWSAQVGPTPPAGSDFGQIVAVALDGIAVTAMNSIVILTELQRPGGKRLPVADFLRGHTLQVGMRFDVTPVATGAA
jgi:methionyl-tRNA formyltransferase